MGQSFAFGMNFYKMFWIFFIGCFAGVVIETIWCLIRFHRIESRKGLIYGPLNPVYGLGALIMTLLLGFFKDSRDLWIFAFGSVIGGVFEYICSLFQEKILGSVSWDYKKFPLNLNGRINMLYCFFWGLLALVWVKDIYPRLSVMIERIPNNIGIPLTWVLFALTAFDCLISAFAVYRMSKRLKGTKKDGVLWKVFDKRYPDDKINKIYPNMKFKL